MILKYIISFIIALLPVATSAQMGFRVIDQAATSYENGNYRKSLKLLEKAEKMDYGFCGNAKADAYRAIYLIRAYIYIEQQHYELARICLDSIYWEYEGDNLDSIRIRTYQYQIGADSLRSMIDSSLNHTTIECNYPDCFAIIPLMNNKDIIKLRIDRRLCLEFKLLIKNELERVQKWKDKFINSQQYSMLKEK